MRLLAILVFVLFACCDSEPEGPNGSQGGAVGETDAASIDAETGGDGMVSDAGAEVDAHRRPAIAARCAAHCAAASATGIALARNALCATRHYCCRSPSPPDS